MSGEQTSGGAGAVDRAGAWLVSSSPHAHSGASVRRIMLDVVVALAPAMAVAVLRFGLDAVRLITLCVASCVLMEAACRRLMRRDLAIDDLSAVVTGILLAFNLPPGLPGWMAVVGSFVAIVITKQVFGGLGYNPFNPALAGRAALLIGRTPEMTSWSAWALRAPAPGVDAITTATPLGLVKTSLSTGNGLPFATGWGTYWDFFVGNMNGCIGEISACSLLAGGVYLLWRRCITWHVPVSFLGTIAVFATILKIVDPASNYGPVFHLLTGGAMLGALFMATDMVTSPVTPVGQIVFGVGCGLLTMVIRKWGGYPEGVSFAILLMNAFVPLINRATRPRVFGHGAAKRG